MKRKQSKQEQTKTTERIAKRIARAGLCSRRDAEKWIADKRVKVNGQLIDSPAMNVSDSDTVMVDNKRLPQKEETRLFLHHKPTGLVTTHRDEKNRKTVFDALPEHLPRLISVGRLDLNTEGLLLLTNDGELSRFLELPSTGWKRCYRVRVFGRIDHDGLANLKKGTVIDGVRYRPITAEVEKEKTETSDKEQTKNSWLSVTLNEGKNREIRKVMESLDLQVNRLIRISYGPFNLGKIKPGDTIEVKTKVLHQQIPHFFKKTNHR